MIGTLAAGAASGLGGGSDSSMASSGPAYSGGTQGNITISMGGVKVPAWGWAVLAAVMVGGVVVWYRGSNG